LAVGVGDRHPVADAGARALRHPPQALFRRLPIRIRGSRLQLDRSKDLDPFQLQTGQIPTLDP
jgi:hypothetical protein